MATALAKAPAYTEEQIKLIKNTVAVGATDDELKLFLHVCKNHKLDPFTRQIHFVKRAGKGTIQISIDGFRAIAERTGKYAGNDDPVFDDEQKPTKATVTVYKMVEGIRCPFTASARWAQYFPGENLGFMWKKMPHLMLGKTAEALALRKAFPEAMSGLYTDEEMAQADEPHGTAPASVEPPADVPATKEEMDRIAQLCKDTGYDPQKLYAVYKVTAPTVATAPAMIKSLEKMLGKMLDEQTKANS